MEGALSSEKSAFGKMSSDELLSGASSLGRERIECRVPIIVRQESDENWQASLELPSEMLSLAKADQYRVLAAVEESVAELQRLHSDSDTEPEEVPSRWLRLACSLWISNDFNGEIQCSVNFEWPEMWIDFASPTRASVLDGIDRMLDQVRNNLERPSPTAP